MSSFDSDNDFLNEDYYETNGNFYSANGVYQGWLAIRGAKAQSVLMKILTSSFILKVSFVVIKKRSKFYYKSWIFQTDSPGNSDFYEVKQIFL